MKNEDMAKETCRAGMTACKSVAEGYYKELTYGPIDNSAYLEGLSDSKTEYRGAVHMQHLEMYGPRSGRQ